MNTTDFQLIEVRNFDGMVPKFNRLMRLALSQLISTHIADNHAASWLVFYYDTQRTFYKCCLYGRLPEVTCQRISAEQRPSGSAPS